MRLALVPLACAVFFAGAASAAAQPALEAGAVDGIRACQSIVEGRTPADAASIFGFTVAGEAISLETDRGKIEILPPAADRRSCRVQVYALVLENKDVLDAVAAFLTTPPRVLCPAAEPGHQERIGAYAAALRSGPRAAEAKASPC